MDVSKKDIGSCHLFLYDLDQPVMLHIGFKPKSNFKKVPYGKNTYYKFVKFWLAALPNHIKLDTIGTVRDLSCLVM